MAAPRFRRWPFSLPGARLGALTLSSGIIVVALLAYGALVYSPGRQRESYEEWQRQLEALLEDRVASIDQWILARLADARTLADYPTLRYVLSPDLPPPYPFPVEQGARAHLEDLFARYAAEHGQRGTWLYDSAGILRAGVGDPGEPPAVVRNFAAALLRGDSVRAVLSSSGEAVLVGSAVADPGGGRLGVVVVEVPTTAFLTAVLDVAPGRARSTEALLVTGDGRYLAVSHDPAGARQLAPVSPGGAERSAAARPGRHRGEEEDRRGEEVLAVSAGLDAVPWRVLLKVDRADAVREARGEMREVAALVAGLLMALGGMVVGLRAEHRATLERAQRGSDQRIRTLAENASDVIYRVRLHPEASFEFVNRAVQAVTGYAPEEFLADPTLGARLVHPEDRHYLDEARTTVPDQPVRLRWVHRDGHIVWLEQRAVAIRDAAGRLVAVEGVGRDITRQHEAEISLREAHERLQLALDVGGIGLYELDVPTMKGTLTTAYAAKLGLRDGHAAFAEWQEAVHPDDRARALTLLARVIGHGPDTYEHEYRIRHADGTWHWVHTLARVTARDASGRALRMLGVHADTTARRTAEEALRTSETRYRTMFEQVGVGVIQATLDRRITQANERFAEMLGYAREELTGLSAADLTHREDADADTAHMAPLLTGQTAMYTVEKRYLHKDGSAVWANVTVSLMHSDDGVAYLLEAVEDIRPRKRAEAALRESQERHRTLFDTTTQGIVYRTADGTIVDMNPAAAEIVGAQRDPATGRWTPSDWALLDENGESVPEENAPHRVALRTGRPVRNAVYGLYNQRQGAYRWALVNSQAVVAGGGDAPSHVYTTLSDLTPLRHAEAALEDAREMYRAVVENTHQVIARFDRELRYTYINPACSRFAPYTPAQLIGRTHAEIGFSEDITAQWDTNIRAVFADGIPRVDSYVLPGPNGPQHFEWRLFPEFDSLGQVRTVVTVSTDVTETRLLEEQYQQAQKMEAVGRLAGGVAHDFNNLITAIRGYASFVHDDLPAGDRMREDIAEILRASDRAAGLTRQLLAFSRKQVLKPEVLDLGAVVQQMEKLLRRLIGEDVLLELDVATEHWRTLADAGQMEQVVMNLAVNARDAMPRGGKLAVSVRPRTLHAADARFDPPAAAGDYIELAVQDVGDGMPPEALEHLFEPFFTTKEKGKGTGLGLSTVYGIVRQSGGAIRVQSELGVGSRFEILLPRSASTATAHRGHATEARSGGETILVVEDESAVRSLARRMLEGAGYRVLVASSGQDALALAARESGAIDLLLTDVVMPGLSGRDLARAFLRSRPHTRVLFMSGYTDDVIGAHGLLEPGVSLLQKPFESGTLRAAVRATLDRGVALF